MIRSVLYLRPKNNDAAALVQYYRNERILERAVNKPGCLEAQLHVPLAEGEPLIATALWESADAYQGWVGDPWRAASMGELNRLLEDELAGDVRGCLYEVALAVVRSGDSHA